MLSLSGLFRFMLYREQTDMRKGFDGLAGIVRNSAGKDPLSGDIFIFFNKRRNQIKLLLWENDGFSLYHKRLEKGSYELPEVKPGIDSMQIKREELLLILEGISLKHIRKRVRFENTLLCNS